MSDQKISQLTTTATLNNADIFPVVQSGVNKSITTGNLKDIFGTNSIPATITLYVDINRTDSYTATGSIDYPYKTIMAAMNVGATAALANGFAVKVAYGAYSEKIDLDAITNLSTLYKFTIDTEAGTTVGGFSSGNNPNSQVTYCSINNVTFTSPVNITGNGSGFLLNGGNFSNGYIPGLDVTNCQYVNIFNCFIAYNIALEDAAGINLVNCNINMGSDWSIPGSCEIQADYCFINTPSMTINYPALVELSYCTTGNSTDIKINGTLSLLSTYIEGNIILNSGAFNNYGSNWLGTFVQSGGTYNNYSKPFATTTQQGITQLSDSYVGSSHILAVTEYALSQGLSANSLWHDDGTNLSPINTRNILLSNTNSYNITDSSVSINSGTSILNGLQLQTFAAYATPQTFSNPLQLVDKAYVDSVIPGVDYWEIDSTNSYLYPTNNSWYVYTDQKYLVQSINPGASSSSELGIISTPYNAIYLPNYVPAQGLVTNGIYLPVSDSFTFRYNVTTATAAGYLYAYSLGTVEEFATFYQSPGSDVSISANLLYNGYVNPSSMTFMALYENNLAATDGSGVAHTYSGHQSGGAAITSTGWLDLSHNDNRYVSYSINSNVVNPGKGCIRFMLQPNYSGTPATDQFFVSAISNSSNNNLITIYQHTDGGLYFTVFNGSAIQIVQAGWGTWSPVAGKIYEFALDYDVISGKTRLFVNGVPSTAATNTGSMSTDIGILYVGQYPFTGFQNLTSNFKITNVTIYNTPQFPLVVGGYVPGYYLENTYLKRNYQNIIDTYQAFSDSIYKNILIGELNSGDSNAMASSFNQLSRTSLAFNNIGNQQIPLWVINGQYNYRTDQFFLKTNGTNAYGSVITSINTDGLDIYTYSTSSIYDVNIPAQTILNSANLNFSIDSSGITHTYVLDPVQIGLAAGPGGIPLSLNGNYQTFVITTIAHNTNDYVLLPLASLPGDKLTVVMRYSGGGGNLFYFIPQNVGTGSSDKINGVASVFAVSMASGRIDLICDAVGSWVLTGGPWATSP